MSEKYKLVPVEPTQEMEQAGGDAVYWENIEDVCGIYRAMLAVAPVVQGEPVATLIVDEDATSANYRVTGFRVDALSCVPLGEHDLFLAPPVVKDSLTTHPAAQDSPRPAEQQSACVSQSVKSDSQAALSAESERQAPDVPSLTEALRQYQHNDGSGLVFGYDKLLVDQYVTQLRGALKWLRGAINCTPENDKHQSGAWISTKHPRIRQIDELLAAYRNQGG